MLRRDDQTLMNDVAHINQCDMHKPTIDEMLAMLADQREQRDTHSFDFGQWLRTHPGLMSQCGKMDKRHGFVRKPVSAPADRLPRVTSHSETHHEFARRFRKRDLDG